MLRGMTRRSAASRSLLSRPRRALIPAAAGCAALLPIDDEVTAAVVSAVQQSGEAWLGGTVWHGMGAARVSFSNWSTTDADVDRLAAALSASLAAR